MMYSVFKILQEGDKQLLLIKQADDTFSFAVYDEHTGNTLMRMSQPTLENLESAIKIIKNQSSANNKEMLRGILARRD